MKTSPTPYVLYWMQAAPRAARNPALEHALQRANSLGLPLLVLFCLDPDVPEANRRHFRFLLQGLWETARELSDMGVAVSVVLGALAEVVPFYTGNAVEVVTEQAVLRWQREARLAVKTSAVSHGAAYTEMCAQSVVPVGVASAKEEYSAATIRSKLVKLLPEYLDKRLPEISVAHPARPALPPLPEALGRELDLRGFSTADGFIKYVETALGLEGHPLPVASLEGGYRAAVSRLKSFIHNALPFYAQSSNNPTLDLVSGLSPYLHFGQISPLEVVWEVLQACAVEPLELPSLIISKAGLTGMRANCAAFCEQLIVRRELSMNFCYYNPHYDEYSCLPSWARDSLERHRRDKRPALFSPETMECAETSDPYWNAAQREMLVSGKMHNYMRMYWGKKVIEWTPDPQTAFYLLQYLNNRYELDGRDPNGFAGVAWCFGKHDRPWQSRPVFGSVRYMNAAGLVRKFDMRDYVDRWGQDGSG